MAGEIGGLEFDVSLSVGELEPLIRAGFPDVSATALTHLIEDVNRNCRRLTEIRDVLKS